MATACTLAVVGAKDVAGELGKKGTSSDVTLYNRVHDEHAVTVVEPTMFPEKFVALLYALALADEVVVVVRELNREIAETFAAVDLFEKPTRILYGTGVSEAEVRRVLRGLRLAETRMTPYDVLGLRAEVDLIRTAPRPGPVRVPLDHAFPVKGVGPVALGVVRQGTLRVHDRLELFPTGRSVEVRSIQVHDQDVPEAVTAQRVGVALRGVDAEELERGQVLAPSGSLNVGTELGLQEVRRSPYYRGDLASGGKGNVLVGLQFVPVEVTPVSGSSGSVVADRPVAFAPGDAAFVADLSVPTGPRLAWRGSV